MDYTDDEDVTSVVELPQAESTAEENNISKPKKTTKKGKSKSKWECGFFFTRVLFPLSFNIFSLCALTDQIITDMRSWCINNMVSLSELNLLCTAAKWEAFRSVQIFPSSCPRRFGRLHRWKTKFEFESIWSFTYPGEHSPSTAVQARFEDFVNFSTGDKKIDLESISSFIPPGAHDQSWSDYDNFEDFVNCSAGDKTQNLKAFYLLSIQENIVNPELSKTTSTTLSTSPQVIRNGI